MRAGDVGVIVEDLVAVVEAWAIAEPIEHASDRVRGGGGEAQVARTGQDHAASGIVEGLHALAALDDDGRGAHALQGQAALLADRPEAVRKDLVADRVDGAR